MPGWYHIYHRIISGTQSKGQQRGHQPVRCCRSVLGVTAVCPHLGFISPEAISFDTPSSLPVTPPLQLVSWSKNQTTEERDEEWGPRTKRLFIPGDVVFNVWDIGDGDVLARKSRHARTEHTILSSSRPRALEQLLTQRRPQTGVLRPLDGQPVDRVVVDHLCDGVEGSAELAQYVLTPARQLDPHVHEPVAAPRKGEDIILWTFDMTKHLIMCSSPPSYWEGRQQTMAETRGSTSEILHIIHKAEAAGAAAVLTNNSGAFAFFSDTDPFQGQKIGGSLQFLKWSGCFPFSWLCLMLVWGTGVQSQDSHTHTAQAWVASLKIWLDAWQRSRPWLGIYRSIAWSSQWWTEKDWRRYEPSSCLVARTRQQRNILIHFDFKSFSAALSRR